MSGITSATTLLDAPRIIRAARLPTYPISEAAWRTRNLVSSLMRASSESARPTVETEIPRRSAMSLVVIT